MTQKNLTIRRLLSPAARSTTTEGSAVDLAAYIHPGGRGMKAKLDLSATAGTTPSVAVKIQDSDTTTAADFTDVTGAVFTTVTATTGAEEEIHFVTNKRYVRALMTITANTTSVTGGVYVLNEKLFT